jgi:uncharacterized membrane protein YeaQ/YmgE (transglycosylase-associated protein family)
MEILWVIIAMVVVGLIMGAVAGFIWKDHKPYGTAGDYIIAVITCVIIGFIDWYVIPAMNFSDTIRSISLLFEPALGALLVLWLVRKAKK